MSKICCDCRRRPAGRIEYSVAGIPRLLECARCAECDEKDAEAFERRHLPERSREAVEKFFSNVPRRYRETDPNHPEFGHKLFAAVSAWMPDAQKPWLVITGTTGRCKTRVAVLKGHELARTGREVRFMSASEWATAVRSQFGDEAGKHQRTIADARTARVLIFDDLGKIGSLSPAISAALFDLIESRLSRNAPTILTANNPLVETLALMAAEYREPTLGRILEGAKLIAIE